MRTHRDRCVSALALAAALGVVGMGVPAWAQDQEGASRPDESQIEDIVVTAQRRSERLQDVPISITTISSDTLKAAGASQLQDIATVTPGLQFQAAGSNSQPMIRGVGTSSISPGFGSNVGVYIDGFLLPNPGTTNFQLPNVSSIEVLKGPQGTLFGRNTTGGAILVLTSDPSITPAMSADFSYGSYNTVKASAYVTGGLGSRLALDLSVQYERGDSFITNIVNGDKAGTYNSGSVRVGLKYQISDDASLMFRYTHADQNDARLVYHGVYCCNADGRPVSSQAYVPGVIIATKPDEVSADQRLPGETHVDAYQLTGKFDFGFASLTSYTQYRDETNFQGVDLDSSSVPTFGGSGALTLSFPYRDRVFTQELILASRAGNPLQWTAGFYYFNDLSTAFTDIDITPTAKLRLADTHNRATTIAGYLDATYALTDRLFITGGVRVAHDTFGGATKLNFGVPSAPIEDVNKTTVTPRAVIRFKPTNSSSIYASYTQGYKSGGRTIAAANENGLIKPEQITSYEVGYKLSTRAVRLNLSAYYYDYKDLQVTSYQQGNAVILNAASSRIYGAEGDVHLSVSRAFTVNAGFAYTNAKYKAFNLAPYAIQCTTALVGVNPNCPAGSLGSFVPPALSARDLRDSPMQFAPEFSGNVGASYTTPLANGDLTLSGTLTYVSKMYFDPAAQFGVGGRENLNLRAEWRDPSDHLSVAVFAQNVTNRRYLVAAMFNTSAAVTNWNAPVTLGGSVGVKF